MATNADASCAKRTQTFPARGANAPRPDDEDVGICHLPHWRVFGHKELLVPALLALLGGGHIQPPEEVQHTRRDVFRDGNGMDPRRIAQHDLAGEHLPVQRAPYASGGGMHPAQPTILQEQQPRNSETEIGLGVADGLHGLVAWARRAVAIGAGEFSHDVHLPSRGCRVQNAPLPFRRQCPVLRSRREVNDEQATWGGVSQC